MPRLSSSEISDIDALEMERIATQNRRSVGAETALAIHAHLARFRTEAKSGEKMPKPPTKPHPVTRGITKRKK